MDAMNNRERAIPDFKGQYNGGGGVLYTCLIRQVYNSLTVYMNSLQIILFGISLKKSALCVQYMKNTLKRRK
jgi:hypothetical protein